MQPHLLNNEQPDFQAHNITSHYVINPDDVKAKNVNDFKNEKADQSTF